MIHIRFALFCFVIVFQCTELSFSRSAVMQATYYIYRQQGLCRTRMRIYICVYTHIYGYIQYVFTDRACWMHSTKLNLGWHRRVLVHKIVKRVRQTKSHRCEVKTCTECLAMPRKKRCMSVSIEFYENARTRYIHQ